MAGYWFMAADKKPIIVKKVKGGGHGGHHGGAWKIAYADFVTAMMAFFLLLWLLSSTDKHKIEGIQEYFRKPLKEVISSGQSMVSRESVINGGGKDITTKKKLDTQAKTNETKARSIEKRLDKNQKKDKAESKSEAKNIEELKKKIEEAIESNPTLKEFKKQLLVDITTEGLRVQIVDDQNRPMFELAKSNLQPYTQKILKEIGHVLNGLDNRISLSGHTDAAAYPNKDRAYSNWELSADRANASRRELVQGGMNPEKLVKVVGLSSAALLDKSNPLNPINRRISIVIMNNTAEENLMKDNGAVDISSKDSQSKISETVKAK